MKKIFTVLIIFLFAVSAFGQIQNKFFESELGVSSFNQVKSNLAKLGFEYHEDIRDGETMILIPDCRYQGNHWDGILLRFYKDLFYEILFTRLSEDENQIKEDFDFFEMTFNIKYADYHMDQQYVVPKESARRTEMYSDYKGNVILRLEHMMLNYETLVLTYSHKQISEEMLFEQLRSY